MKITIVEDSTLDDMSVRHEAFVEDIPDQSVIVSFVRDDEGQINGAKVEGIKY